MVVHGLGDTQRGPGLVEGPSLRSGTGWGALVECRDGSGTVPGVWDGSGELPEVWDGSGDPRVVVNRSGDPPGGSGQVRILSSKFWQVGGQGVVQDGLVDPREGRGRLGGPSFEPAMGRGSLGAVRNWLGDPHGGQGQFVGPSFESGTGRGASLKSRTGWLALWEVRDWSGYPR